MKYACGLTSFNLQVYAARRTMPNVSADDAWLSRCCRLSGGRWLRAIRHSLVAQSASPTRRAA